MTISSCLYPNRSVYQVCSSRFLERRDGEGNESHAGWKRKHTNQKLLNVRSIIDTSSQLTLLTKVVDPNLLSVIVTADDRGLLTYKEGFSIPLTYSLALPRELDQGD